MDIQVPITEKYSRAGLLTRARFYLIKLLAGKTAVAVNVRFRIVKGDAAVYLRGGDFLVHGCEFPTDTPYSILIAGHNWDGSMPLGTVRKVRPAMDGAIRTTDEAVRKSYPAQSDREALHRLGTLIDP